MIRKIFLICLSVVLSSATVYAEDMTEYCVPPHNMSLKATHFTSTITGFTPLSQAIANTIIKKEITKATGTKQFKVKMKSFSGNDLVAGRFKSLKIQGKNLNLDGIYLTRFNANTICDFNYVKPTRNSIVFVDDFPMEYSMTISDEDLRKTVLSKDYLAFLNSLNLKFDRVNLLELKDVDVKLIDDKFHFMLKMNNNVFHKNIRLTMNLAAKMKIEDGKIKVTEVYTEGLNQKINLTQMTNILNLINPLNFTIEILGNSNSKIALKNLEIKGDKLVLDGTLLIPKNTQETKK